MTHKSLVLVFAVVASCGGNCNESSAPTETWLPTISGQLPDLQMLKVGESVVVDLVITESDGSPTVDFEWMPSITNGEVPEFDIVYETGPGTIRVSITALHSGTTAVSGTISLDGGRAFQTAGMVVAVRAWGGETELLEPVQESMTLVVGEARPTFAFPIETGGLSIGYYTGLADDPANVIFTVADTGVATVNDKGVVTGVAQGTTTLVMAHGGKDVSVPIVVAAGSVQLPPIGEFEMLELPNFRLENGFDVSHLMAVDSRGYPSFVASVRPEAIIDPNYGLGWPVVFSWTGSGWGAELAGRAFDTASKPQLVIDAVDTKWVLYFGNGLRISGRPEPVLAQLGSTGVTHTQFHHPHPSNLDNISSRIFSSEFGLFPRRDGGVWVLYSPLAELSPLDENGARICESQLILVEATATQTTSTVVIHNEVEFRPLSNGQECPYSANPEFTGLLTTALEILPPLGDAQFPHVVAPVAWRLCEGEADPNCPMPVVVLAFNGTQFEFVDYGGEIDMDIVTKNTTFKFTDAHVARDTRAPFDDFALVLSFNSSNPLVSARRDLVLFPNTFLLGENDFEGAGVWSFRRQGQTYFSHRLKGSMTRMDANGYAHKERYQHNLRWDDSTAFDESGGSFSAWAVSDERMYLFDQIFSGLNMPHLVSLPLPEDMPDPTDVDESTGALLRLTDRTNSAFGPIALLANGQRVVLGLLTGIAYSNEPPMAPQPLPRNAIYISNGPGQPFVGTELATNTPVSSEHAWLVRAVGNDLFTFFQNQLVRSTDSGLTWSPFGPAGVEFDGFEITPAGRFVGVRRVGNWEVYEDTDITDGLTPVLLASGLPIPLSDLEPFIGDDGDIYLFGGYNGTIHMVQMTDGVVQPTVVMNIDSNIHCSPGEAVVNAAGDLLAACYSGETTLDAYLPQVSVAHLLYRNGATGAVSVTERGPMAVLGSVERGNPPAQIESLANGNVVLAWTSEDRQAITRSVVVSASADFGQSWGPPTAVRPQGGFGQALVGLIGDATGGLWVTMADNGSISGDIGNAPQVKSFKTGVVSAQSQDKPRTESMIVHMTGLVTQ